VCLAPPFLQPSPFTAGSYSFAIPQVSLSSVPSDLVTLDISAFPPASVGNNCSTVGSVFDPFAIGGSFGKHFVFPPGPLLLLTAMHVPLNPSFPPLFPAAIFVRLPLPAIIRVYAVYK
jgi:hypothetical protein